MRKCSDGLTYGIYEKKGIVRIIYVNANDTQVYGRYEVNEYGNVS